MGRLKPRQSRFAAAPLLRPEHVLHAIGRLIGRSEKQLLAESKCYLLSDLLVGNDLAKAYALRICALLADLEYPVTLDHGTDGALGETDSEPRASVNYFDIMGKV